MKHKFKLTRLWVASLLLLFGISPNAWAGNFVSNGNTKLYINNINGCGLGDSKWIVDGGVGWMYMVGSSSATSSYNTQALTHTSHDDVYYITINNGTYSSMYLKRGQNTSTQWNETKSISFGNNGENYLVGGYSKDGGGATWVYAADDALIYFDNSVAQWNDNRIMFLIGRSDYNSPYQMANITNTKLYYYKINWWANYTKYGVIGVGSDGWGAESSDISNRYTHATHHTKLNAHAFQNCTALLTYNSTSNNQDLTKTEISGYSALNKTITIAAKVGGTEAATPGKLTASSYKFSDYNTCGTTTSVTLNVGSTTTNCVVGYTAKTTLTATDADGYTFTGWYNGSTLVSSNKSVTVYPHGGETYYACYTENTYSITFDANGGSSSMSDQTGLGCATAQTIKANEFTAPTGYHFIGWSKTKDGDVVYEDEGTVEALTVTTQGGTLKLYAQWAPNTHTLSWNWDGGSTTDENYTKAGTVAYGTAIVYPTNASMSYAGHNFTGWDKSNTTMPDNDLTITAQWEVASSYTLSFAKGCDDEVTDMPDPITQSTQTFSIPSTLPKRTGYTFSVWRDNNSEQYPAGGSITITGNTTLTAVWSANTNTSYVVNHKRQALDGTYPADLTETENKTGTTATPADLKTKSYTGFTTPETQEATILADGSLVVNYQYERKSYTLTWNLNGGTITTAGTDAGQVKYEAPLTAPIVSKTGYNFTSWNPSVPETMPATNSTYTAQWQAKTYTISFNQNGGEGGQTGTVTATYAAAMPALQNFTAPTRVGYKFNGYWDAASNGTKYYNADGTSAKAWNKDANTTLYAQWTQMHVYVQGRMHVANKKRSEGGDITWTNSFNGGTQTETNNQWAEACRAIEMQLVTENDRTYYKLVTNATLSDLSSMFGDAHNLPQYFYLRSTSTTSGSTWDGSIYKQVGNDNPFKLADRGEEHARTWSTAEGHNPRFSDDDRSGYVVIYFDETKVWYELDEFTTYDVEFSNGGGGGTVTPSGTKKTGEVSWEVTVNPNEGYSFAGWTLTGGAKAKENDDQLKTYYTIHVTATGDGKAIANFKIKPKIYFQTCNGWGEKVYVYFYKGNYWDNTYGAGSQKSGNCISDAIEMHYTGGNNIHYAYYDVESLRDKGMDNHIAFTSGSQTDKQYFYQTNVVWLGNFSPCDNPLFVADGFDYEKNECGYYKGHWSNMLGDDAEDYLMMESENWKPNENMRFKKDNNGNWIVIKNYSGFANDYHDEFRIWRNCDGNWYGCGQTESHNQNITSDISGWKLYTGTSNIDITPWKEGDYEFKWNPNSQELSVTYLGDITVKDFPGEVSTFVNRQHKIKPDVTLRNGTSVTDVKILVEGHELPWSSSYATYEQNGTNLVITGNAIGTDDNLIVRYQNNKQPDPYIVDRTLKVNVADPIIIQAKLMDDDTHWTKTGLVHIHFWGAQEGTAQDLTMSYNSETKLFSVTAPMISNPFNFMFWYGEDINSCASEAWRKTENLSTYESACYTIDNTTSNEMPRNAEKESGLCSTDEYYVEITMKNGNTYKSNTISNRSKEVSFFAPKSNDDTYTGGTVRIVHNGVVSDPITTGFDSAYVYVATINSDANGFATLSAYKGNYYIRTDGADGMWNDYKTNDDNVMIEFTKRPNKNESYSYYWVKNVAKTEKTNVKGDVANDYNDNLANMIENDKFTDGGGFIYQSTNGANVRFSYEPTTNEFKRAIIGGSTDDNFLNIYSKESGRLYADKDCMKELNANADLPLSKFSDVSDWVYEKVVYAQADGSHPTSVVLKSVYNGQTSHLLGYNKNAKGEDTDDPKPLEVLGATTNSGTYALRISYDYKRNRLMASWEPGSIEISSSQVIDADVLFIQKEDANGLIDDVNVAQITYTDAGITAKAKLTSLKNIMYILEVTPTVISGTSADNQLYWFSLPFNCKINDIFGVEDYVTLDANGQATAGTWGIQRYDGATRASHGWFQDDNPEGFWRWMKRNETLVAGTGYVLVFDKTNASSWKSIGVEEPCKDGEAGCTDGKKTVERKIKRLYFPSIGTSFEISYSGESSSVPYTDNPCNIEKRRAYDGNWKVIGPVSYNNIGVDNTADKNLTFYYTYNQAGVKGNRYEEKAIDGETNNVLKSFHSYMTQFGGTLTWKPFTKSSEVVKAPHYTENPEFQGGMLTIELRNAKGEELNHTFINLSKNGTTGFDQNLDLTKITENCAQIASVSEDVLYAGNTLPLDIEMVPLNVKVVANGTYDIALEQSLEGLEVRLLDAFEQTTTPLDLMSATVTLDKGEYKDRFFLQFVQKSPLTPTNLNGSIDQFNLPTDKTQKLLINDNIYLINAGRIYNVLGARP